MKRVVVTGATSFIGAVTVRKLLERGYEVCAVVRPHSANRHHLEAQVPESGAGRLTVAELDLNQIQRLPEVLAAGGRPVPADSVPEAGIKAAADAAGREEELKAAADAAGRDEGLKAAADAAAPEADGWDAWIHIGWDGAGSDNRTKRDVQQGNVRQSLAAVRTAARLGCRRFVFTGSQAEYGVCHSLISEETECHPVSEYGKAKVNFANEAKKLCKILKMEYIHTRIFSVYGPGDHPWSLVQSCLRTWQEGGAMKLGECTQQWNFLYIEDAADALIALLTKGRAGVYNIAGNDTRILREYIEEMYALCGSLGSFAYGERQQNAEGPADLMPDISKICGETGWRPATSFAEGIYETLHSLWEGTS